MQFNWQEIKKRAKQAGRSAFKTKKRTFATILFAFLLIWGLFSLFYKAEIELRHRYKIARDLTWPSSVLSGKERNFEGFLRELLGEISKIEDVRFDIVTSSTQTILSNLENGSYDAMISLIPPTPSNERYYVFSDPLLLLGPVLLVRADSNAKSLADMSGKIVAVRTGAGLVFNYIHEATNESVAPPMFTTFDSMNEALDRLVRNQIDGVIMETMPAYIAVEGFYKGQLKVASAPLTLEGVRVVALISKNASERLIEIIDHGLKVMREDKSFQQLILKWALIDPSDRTPS